ncbi:MAG: tRNA pseudouridine(38-40) synthase TruA [Myxococcales bacterium]|nr:tRNA pseudouridine(38-40) synthase TruA [Myxococcales bacterium]
MSRCCELLDPRVWYWRPSLHAQRAVVLPEAFHYRVVIAYKGTNYHGWQAQTADSDNEPLPSVQGTIARILSKIARYGECSISGTSRTDAGVHAQGQVGKISIPTYIDSATLLRGMNSMLPESIRMRSCVQCEAGFNPKVGATSKEYHYYLSLTAVANPSVSDIVAHIPGPMDLELLERATQVFVGRHDFYSFCRRSTRAATTIREVYKCEFVRPTNALLVDEVYALRITGNGFLKQMVRYMASTLFAVGQGALTIGQVAEHLAVHSEDKLCPKAPAHGLHLVSISGL